MSNQLNENEQWKTAELALASALSLHGFPLLALDRSQGRRVFFVFSNSSELQSTVGDFWNGTVPVDARLVRCHQDPKEQDLFRAMKLSDTDILEFQELCRSQLGLEIPWEQAQDGAIKLLRLVKLTYKPMRIEEYEELRKKDVNENDNEPARPEIIQ